MTIRNAVVPVGVAEVTAFDPGQSGAGGNLVQVTLFPGAGNSGSVYVGAAGLTADTATTGGTIVPAAGLTITLRANEVLKAIGSAAAQKLVVLASGV
jgi:hypothetical protein